MLRAAKNFVFSLWVFGFGASYGQASETDVIPAQATESGTVISATPRLIRSQPETEIFFRDHNTSYVIPKDDSHNRTYELVEKAMKAKNKVSLRVDPKSRRVLGIETQPASEEAGKK